MTTCDTEKVTFLPNVDVYEEKNNTFLLFDMPGVDEKNVSIELEKGILKVVGKVNHPQTKGLKSYYSEYYWGDYERSFQISDIYDSDNIQAVMSDGVLRIELVKKQPQAKKIEVKIG